MLERIFTEDLSDSKTFTLGGYILKTLVKSLYIWLSSDLFVAFRPSVRRLKDRGCAKLN